MANYATIKAAIDQYITTNGNNEITGAVLNSVLDSVVDSLGANYQFAGVATPSTNPGTPDQNVFYFATQAGTYSNFNNIVLPDGISILSWNGSWSSSTLSYSEGVFDISAYHATGGTLAEYADLTAALGTSGANIPEPIRKGGMSVKFLQSSDNKYVQYRLMSDTFNTTVANWQGVDDEPIAGSKNLVESGGVKSEFAPLEPIRIREKVDGIIVSNNTWKVSSTLWGDSVWIEISGCQQMTITPGTSAGYFAFTKSIPASDGDALDYATGSGRTDFYSKTTVNVPSDAKYLYVMIKQVQNGTAIDRTPSSVIVDGFDYILDIVNNIQEFYKNSVMPKDALPSGDVDNVLENGIWILDGDTTYTNLPAGIQTGFLRVSILTSSISMQECWDFSGNLYFKRRKLGANYSSWKQIGGSGNIINNDYTFNEYSQTVNLTASPSITTDTNNYLAASGDATNRTSDILTVLTATGVCNLGPGDFYIDGLVMPDNSELRGCGAKTRLILIAGENKFAIKMGKLNIVKDLYLLGMTGWYESPSSTVGTRHGILWAGNYTQSQTSSTQPQFGKLSNLYIRSFAGGGITCYDTGYGTDCYMEVVNCLIMNCDAGINISYWSEFHKFTNVRCISNYYGCINNGGNNVFVNCDFSSNTGIAFLIDNSQSQSPNPAHGSCVACIFNHTASNTGIGIKILNTVQGFVFDGCQIFFSKIYLEDSKGVLFSNCNGGANNCDITVINGGLTIFNNYMFETDNLPITITGNQQVHFINCYNKLSGNAVSN